jgi:sulfoxide reductase heme-binding subunit YedZ
LAFNRSKIILKNFLFVASLIPLGWLIFALWSDTVNGSKFMTADPVQKLNRELGDWALIFITITLAIRPISEIFNSRYLIAYRRMLGLFAFFYAALHLTSYVVIDLQLNWDDFAKDLIKRNFILVGIIAFVLMTPLAITSNKKMIKLLGSKVWQRLHLLIYPIAVLGIFHFFMMVRADYSRPLIYLTVILALLAYRYWKNVITATPKTPVNQSSKSAKQSFYKRVLHLPGTIKSSK